MNNSKLLANGSKAKRIFIVDDDAMTRTIIRTMLEASGFEVIAAGDGEELFRLIESEARPLNIFCIILDVQMPGMNGAELMRAIRADDKLKELPAIMMLAVGAAKQDVLDAVALGISGFVIKPFRPDQLRLQVKKVLGW